ncbi:MAG: Phosphoribosylaminoimidazole carboxylase, ATPase subunit, partial [Alphaproteobacteria bacterium]|nr:Phosphoribosylaminoimidazole carboxylase, ATPase subunit [Alphaproteobacteria bacterium]
MKTLQKPVPPGGTIGIIGGGQLGRMLALAAARLGLKTCIYNDAPDAPAFQVTPDSVSAPYDDLDALSIFAARCDAVTFEFENLPAHAIAHLESQVAVRPGAAALAITQDRLS